MLCRENRKSVVCHACRQNAGSEFLPITKKANVWRVATSRRLSSRVRMYPGTNRAEVQKPLVTLRDNTNE
jgi:hypothetical protein